MSISRAAFLMAVLASTCLAVPARADDLAATVAGQLRDSGALSGYRVNVKSKSGTVWLEGRVADQQQLAAAVGITEATPGVERVVNRLTITPADAAETTGGFGMPASAWNMAGLPGSAPKAAPRTTAATVEPAAVASPVSNPLSAVSGLFFAGGSRAASASAGQVRLTQATQPVGQMNRNATAKARPMNPPRQAGSPRTAMRTSGYGDAMVLPAPGGYDGPLVDGQMVPGTMQYSEGYAPGGMAPGGYAGGPGGPGMGGPMPMAGTGMGMPPVPMRADGPNMPNYAWPSYAAYPNYAGLQYPTQYSPTAWPYIGPFYPYPQVPLGWRRVSLEWDDGWWWLDFDDRHIHSHHR